MGAPLPDRHTQPTLEPTATPPKTLPAPPGDNQGDQGSQITRVPAGYEYSHAPLPCDEFFNLNAYAKDRKHYKDCIPDLRTDEGTSTG